MECYCFLSFFFLPCHITAVTTIRFSYVATQQYFLLLLSIGWEITTSQTLRIRMIFLKQAFKSPVKHILFNHYTHQITK